MTPKSTHHVLDRTAIERSSAARVPVSRAQPHPYRAESLRLLAPRNRERAPRQRRAVRPLDRKVYNWIVNFKGQNDGNSPTVREIQHGCGISSTSVVSAILVRLEAEELIRMRGEGKWHRIEVVNGRWTVDGNSDHSKERVT